VEILASTAIRNIGRHCVKDAKFWLFGSNIKQVPYQKKAGKVPFSSASLNMPKAISAVLLRANNKLYIFFYGKLFFILLGELFFWFA
jgi:hypothetical protein